MTKTDDPLAKLGNELAADHTLAKARGDTGPEAPDATETENEPEMSTEDETSDEPQFFGDFETFEEARAFATEDGGELRPGDMTVVNSGLVRVDRDGTFKVVISSLLDEYAAPANHEKQHADAMSAIERIVLEAAFESGPLLGNLRDTFIELWKALPKKWSEASEIERRDGAKHLENAARTLIRKVARVVAEGERISVTGKLESFNCKGGFDLKISAPGDEDAVVELYRMTGHEVVITSADSERFLSAGEPNIPSDEPGLPLEMATSAQMAALVEEIEPEIPDDDSDLAGDADEEDELEENDGPNEYESRSNPDDEESDAVEGELVPGDVVDDFEAPAEELAQQAGRSGNAPAGEELPSADYVGPNKPEDAVPGETWVDTSQNDSRKRYRHPNGKWYLSAPTDAALAEWREIERTSAQPKADDGGFPAAPE